MAGDCDDGHREPRPYSRAMLARTAITSWDMAVHPLNAYAKGQNAAIHQVMEHGRRIAEKTAAGAPAVQQSDLEILEAYFRDRAAELALGPLLGDPPDCKEGAGGGL